MLFLRNERFYCNVYWLSDPNIMNHTTYTGTQILSRYSKTETITISPLKHSIGFHKTDTHIYPVSFQFQFSISNFPAIMNNWNYSIFSDITALIQELLPPLFVSVSANMPFVSAQSMFLTSMLFIIPFIHAMSFSSHCLVLCRLSQSFYCPFWLLHLSVEVF